MNNQAQPGSGAATGPQLKPPESFSSLVDVDLYGISHPGLIKTVNEDHFVAVRGGRTLETVCSNVPDQVAGQCFDETMYGMVVADGLGKDGSGAIASRQAIDYLLSLALHTPDWILRQGTVETSKVMWRMSDRFTRVNAELLQEAAAHASLDGMSTTMTAAITFANDLIIAHVGDSRAYLLRQEKLQLLTRDHTLAQRLVDDGIHPPNDHLIKELRGVLMQALGGKETRCRPVVQHLVLEDHDTLLLCTDGLTDMVDEATIQKILNETDSTHSG